MKGGSDINVAAIVVITAIHHIPMEGGGDRPISHWPPIQIERERRIGAAPKKDEEDGDDNGAEIFNDTSEKGASSSWKLSPGGRKTESLSLSVFRPRVVHIRSINVYVHYTHTCWFSHPFVDTRAERVAVGICAFVSLCSCVSISFLSLPSVGFPCTTETAHQ